MSGVSPTQLLHQSPSLTTSFIQQPAPTVAVTNPDKAGCDVSLGRAVPEGRANLFFVIQSSTNTANVLNVPDSSDLFRVRSHFWNEFLPNAEQFNADRRESDLGTLATSLSDDLGSLYDLSTLNQSSAPRFPDGQSAMNGDEMSLAAFATLTQAASGVYPATNAGSSSHAANNIDPSDWLVAYMLDSIQPTKS